MHVPYDDILSRIPEPPVWWSSGVPRYVPFEPHMTYIYAREAMLVDAECQSCGRKFALGLHSHQAGVFRAKLAGPDNMWGWSDPPYHHCHGDSMNVIVTRILEFWEQDQTPGPTLGNWQRDSTLEIAFARP